MSEIKTLFIRKVSPALNAAINRYKKESGIDHATTASEAMMLDYFAVLDRERDERTKRIAFERQVNRFLRLHREKKQTDQAIEDLINAL